MSPGIYISTTSESQRSASAQATRVSQKETGMPHQYVPSIRASQLLTLSVSISYASVIRAKTMPMLLRY
jgi:hypothetical protein